MKYMLIALTAVLVVTGCATNNASAPSQGSYNESSSDRHSTTRVSNNLRSPASIWNGR